MADEKAKPEPEKTGKDLLAYLKETGTGAARLEALDRFLREHKAVTAAEALEYMRSEPTTFWAGTVTKAGQFLYGDGYAYRDPNLPQLSADEEVAARDQRITDLERDLRELRAKNHQLLQENTRLRKVADVRFAQEPELRSGGFEKSKAPADKKELAGAGAR